MKFSKKILMLISGLGVLTLVACGGGSSGFIFSPVDFTAFVKGQFTMTAGNTDPVEVDSIVFDFSNDDPQAYDDILVTP